MYMWTLMDPRLTFWTLLSLCLISQALAVACLDVGGVGLIVRTSSYDPTMPSRHESDEYDIQARAYTAVLVDGSASNTTSSVDGSLDPGSGTTVFSTFITETPALPPTTTQAAITTLPGPEPTPYVTPPIASSSTEAPATTSIALPVQTGTTEDRRDPSATTVTNGGSQSNTGQVSVLAQSSAISIAPGIVQGTGSDTRAVSAIPMSVAQGSSITIAPEVYTQVETVGGSTTTYVTGGSLVTTTAVDGRVSTYTEGGSTIVSVSDGLLTTATRTRNPTTIVRLPTSSVQTNGAVHVSSRDGWTEVLVCIAVMFGINV